MSVLLLTDNDPGQIDIEVDHAAQKLMTVSCTAKVAEAVVAALTDAGLAA